MIHIEPLRKATTPNEMRVAIMEQERDNPIVRAVATTAMVSGLSGEDKYVMMAYYLLERSLIVEKMLLNHYACNLPHIIMPSGEQKL